KISIAYNGHQTNNGRRIISSHTYSCRAPVVVLPLLLRRLISKPEPSPAEAT
ncbi:hypothetical protein L873DRAFT_1799101, partial [Choiromyces venosus 120613-1]